MGLSVLGTHDIDAETMFRVLLGVLGEWISRSMVPAFRVCNLEGESELSQILFGMRYEGGF